MADLLPRAAVKTRCESAHTHFNRSTTVSWDVSCQSVSSSTDTLAHDHVKYICHKQHFYSVLCDARIGPASLETNSAKGMVCFSHLYDEIQTSY